jgi:hypothetical protein
MQQNGMWVEGNPTGTFRYFELGRTAEFIELQDQDRGIFVRLYDNREAHRGPNDPVWQPGYTGQWENNSYPQPGQGVGTVWAYSLPVNGTPSQGSWRDLGNGQWVEANPTGQWNYVETGRGPDYVDLLDQNRNIAVRITPTQEYSRSVNDPNWAPGYQGQWVQ